MGFWGDLWSGFKSVAGKVYDTVRKPVDWISGAGDILRKIPVVGGALDTFLSPITGTARAVQGGLNTAKDLAGVGSLIGLKNGGMVPKKMYQA
jgi:hypothetical protein